MAAALDPNGVTYYKRYRMEMDLSLPLPPVPNLPAESAWIPWEERLLEAHAEVAFAESQGKDNPRPWLNSD